MTEFLGKGEEKPFAKQDFLLEAHLPSPPRLGVCSIMKCWSHFSFTYILMKRNFYFVNKKKYFVDFSWWPSRWSPRSLCHLPYQWPPLQQLSKMSAISLEQARPPISKIKNIHKGRMDWSTGCFFITSNIHKLKTIIPVLKGYRYKWRSLHQNCWTNICWIVTKCKQNTLLIFSFSTF